MSASPRRVPAAAAWFAGALLLFLLLPQRTPHGTDTHYFVVWLQEGGVYARHPLYMTLARLVHDALAPFGVSPYRALLVLSAVASACGVAFAAAAAGRLPLGARARWHVPAGMLAVPAVVYWATAAEIGGVAFGAAGAAWWAVVRWQERPGAARAAVAGLATGIAAGVHAFGHLLVPLLVGAAWLLRAERAPGPSAPRARWGSALAFAGVHAAVAVLAAVVAGAGARGQAADAAGHLRERWATLDLLATPGVLWREWCVPYAPWWIVALLGVAAARSRPWAAVTLLGLLLHLPLTVLLLGSIHADEVGMYLLALAFPLVVTARLLLRSVPFASLVVAGAALAVVIASPKWPAPGTPAFGAALRALREEGAFTLIATRDEEFAARVRVPGVVVLEVFRLATTWTIAEGEGLTVAQWVPELLRRYAAPDNPVLVTERAIAQLRALPPPLDAMWPAIEHAAQVEPVARDGFRGAFVRPR